VVLKRFPSSALRDSGGGTAAVVPGRVGSTPLPGKGAFYTVPRILKVAILGLAWMKSGGCGVLCRRAWSCGEAALLRTGLGGARGSDLA